MQNPHSCGLRNLMFIHFRIELKGNLRLRFPHTAFAVNCEESEAQMRSHSTVEADEHHHSVSQPVFRLWCTDGGRRDGHGMVSLDSVSKCVTWMFNYSCWQACVEATVCVEHRSASNSSGGNDSFKVTELNFNSIVSLISTKLVCMIRYDIVSYTPISTIATMVLYNTWPTGQ